MGKVFEGLKVVDLTTMDAYASVISNNLNVIMKRMTSISMLLMIPTHRELLASKA